MNNFHEAAEVVTLTSNTSKSTILADFFGNLDIPEYKCC